MVKESIAHKSKRKPASQGMSTIHIYNPIKNSINHDTEGIFILKWVPELRAIPMEFIQVPWNNNCATSPQVLITPRPLSILKKHNVLPQKKCGDHGRMMK